MFALGQKNKDEGNDLVQVLVELLMNSLYGIQIRKDNNEFYKCKSEQWMQKQYVNDVFDSWKLPKGKYIVKLKESDGLNFDKDIENYDDFSRRNNHFR